MSIHDNLKSAERCIQSALSDLESLPEKNAIAELLDACQELDVHYKYFCEELDDEDDGEEPTYEIGVDLEFYIEARKWHRISKALRQLKWSAKDIDG